MNEVMNLAKSALDHSDHVEQIVRWALLRVVHVENEKAGRIQDCLNHLAGMQEDLCGLMAKARSMG